MNTISSLLKWIGNLVGADPSTMATTSKTLVGAVNDLSQQISDVDASIKKRTLLWTNPNPSDSLSASTLISGVDLTQYEYLEICVNDRNILGYGYRVFLTEVPSSGTVTFVVSYASRAIIAERYFDVTPTSISCQGGSYINAFGGEPIARDTFVIPYKIYGIK